MEVVTVRTLGSILAAIEIRADFSMVERRPQSIGTGLHLAVAAAGAQVLVCGGKGVTAEATIVLNEDSQLSELIGQNFATGTARFVGLEIDESGLWARPTWPGVVQTGDVVRAIPDGLIDKTGPFPRVPDGLPDAPDNHELRFSPTYEARAERLWDVIDQLGYRPSLEWAGSEDGEAIVARSDDDTVLVVIDLEDPDQQQTIDVLIQSRGLVRWLELELAGRPLE